MWLLAIVVFSMAAIAPLLTLVDYFRTERARKRLIEGIPSRAKEGAKGKACGFGEGGTEG